MTRKARSLGCPGKRELAEAIIGQDNPLFSTLGRAKLELLLS